MESNWRYNVWLFGLGPTRARLAARQPTLVNPNRVIWAYPDEFNRQLVWASTLVGGYAEGAVFQGQFPRVGFPWSIPGVQPDH